MDIDQPLTDLPQSLRSEQKELLSAGINSWNAITKLNDSELNHLASKGLSTSRNLKRLRGIASLVCDLELAPADAALLMYSGLATVQALAKSSPQEVLSKIGRLSRQLNLTDLGVVNIAKAKKWVKKAQTRQMQN